MASRWSKLYRNLAASAGFLATLVAAALVLVSTALVFYHLVDAAPGGEVPREVAFTLRPGQAIEVGRLELLQPKGPAAAVERHIRISREAGGWTIASATGQRRALLAFEGGASTFAHRWPLAAGDEARLPGAIVRFYAVDNVRKTIGIEVETTAGKRRHTLESAHYNRGVLLQEGAAGRDWVGACHERALPFEVLLGLRHLLTGALEGWRPAERLLRRFEDKPRLHLGGVLSCRGGFDVPRLAIPGLEARELAVVERGGRFMLAPGPTLPALVIRRGACRLQGFQGVAWRIDGDRSGSQLACTVPPAAAGEGFGRLSSVVLGRTRYDVAVAGDRLALRPVLNVPVLTPADIELLRQERSQAGILAPLPQLVRVPDRARWIGVLEALRHLGAFDWRAKATLALPVAAVLVLLALRRTLGVWRLARETGRQRSGLARDLLRAGLFTLSLALATLATALLAFGLPVGAGELDPRALFVLVLVNYGVASVAIARAARAGPSLAVLWIATLVLMATGLLNMAQLGFGAESTRYLELYGGQLLVFALLPPAVIAAAVVRLSLVRHAAAPLFAAGRQASRGQALHALGIAADEGRRTVWSSLRRLVRGLAVLAWAAMLAGLALLVVALIGAGLLNALGAHIFILEEDVTPLQHTGYALVALLLLFLIHRLPLIAFSMKAAPLLALSLMFLAWLALGGETGLGPFQPVELGKFAAVAFLSLFLIALDRRQGSPDPVVPLGLFLVYGAAVLFFILLFAVVPALKSDLSPVLIVTLTSGLLVAVAGARQAGRLLFGHGLAERWRRLTDRRWLDAPSHLRPLASGFLRLPGSDTFVAVPRLAYGLRCLALGMALGLAVIAYREVLQPYFWSPYEMARIGLERLLAADDIGKLAQRVLSYRDLDYARPAATDDAGNRRRIVDYRDIGLQVIQSRRAIAAAPCHTLGELVGEPRRLAVLRMLLGPPAPRPGYGPPAKAAATGVAARPRLLGVECGEAGATPFGRNPAAVQRIPAVKDDFAAAFFVNRFGLRAALLLVITQAVMIVVLVAGAFRVRRTASADHREAALRFALFGMMLGGAILLGLHWIISWSNQFGLLPVMGQPMTFLSLGGSHLALMAFPIILVSVIGLRVTGEPDDRRPHFAPRDP
jgi:cell division protein FtsW (lipid II flippase)